MQTTDFLVQHALDNVWMSPMEDEQSVIKLARLTPINGEKRIVDIFHSTINLPDDVNEWHVYMLGANAPLRFTLPHVYQEWMNMKMWCAQNHLIVKFYTLKGKLFPLNDVYVLREDDDNLVFAVKLNPNIDDLNSVDLYAHFYHSQYWDQKLDVLPEERVVISGGMV